MKVLVTGAAGQLGVELVEHCRGLGDVVVAADRHRLDIADPAAVTTLMGTFRPDAVINAAAYTAVDACESDVDLAERVNGRAVGVLREACDDVGAHLVQVSTDYVFDGTLDRPYVESDETNPQSVYGRTKLAGERLAGEHSTIARTSWVCGAHGNNMVKLVLRLAGGDAPLAFVDDQHGHPTFTADLAPALRRLAEEQRGGVFHLTNAGAVSWYEFVGNILEAAGDDRSRVTPIRTADLQPPRPAPRPANSVLENAAWAATGHAALRDHREPLAELVAALRA